MSSPVDVRLAKILNRLLGLLNLGTLPAGVDESNLKIVLTSLLDMAEARQQEEANRPDPRHTPLDPLPAQLSNTRAPITLVASPELTAALAALDASRARTHHQIVADLANLANSPAAAATPASVAPAVQALPRSTAPARLTDAEVSEGVNLLLLPFGGSRSKGKLAGV
jgi:hypothetical protein